MAKKTAKVDAVDIDEALVLINAQFGQGTIRRLGDSAIVKVPVASTGLLSLDRTIGPGGLPRGKTVELYGPESSGKTTLALQILAESQKMGKCAYIDAEHALDPQYAARLGVDVDNLLFSQPDSGEQALEICNMLIKAGGVVCIIIDSVAALTPRAEIEGEIGDISVGGQARMMGQAMRMLTARASKQLTTLIFINQIREKVGVLYGSPETVPGGRALKFFASVRLDVRRRTPIKDGTQQIGAKTQIKVVKNKVGRPFVSTEVSMYFGEGFSRELDLMEVAADLNVLQLNGSHYTYQGEILGQGKDKVRGHLLDHSDVFQEIWDECRQVLWNDQKTFEDPTPDVPIESLPESLEDLPDEDVLPSTTVLEITLEEQPPETLPNVPLEPTADEVFAVRDWYAARANKMIASGSAARELALDPEIALQACRSLAQSGILDDMGKENSKMFIFKTT